MINQPTNKTLNESINGWPEGTVGHSLERDAIIALSNLSKEHGYGRIPQIANAINAIWIEPEKAEEYKKSRLKRLAFLEECRKEVEDDITSNE